MDRGKGRIPRYIDAPVTILIWDVDVFLPAFVLFLVGFFTRNFVTFSLLAAGYIYLITLYQKKFPRGLMDNILHKWGVVPYSGYPSGFITVFRG